ncbi:MAG TPA: restriction endonuclease subunit S [Victivallis vadensis]|nr:restriction endonuclease subunit S [Victivallis vadensis]
MNIKWNERKLSDIATMIDYRGKTPQKSTSGIPLITAKIVKNGTILPANEFIAENQYASWMTRGYPCVGDVVMTTEAPLGEVAQLRDAHVALAQRIITIRGKKDVLDNGYLKYFLQSAEGQGRLRARETGTTVTGIKAAELRELMIPLPDIVQQCKISKVLLDLDEKIYNLTQENHNLEEQAKCLVKSWFVDFEPYGGQVPDSWHEITLSEIADFIGGYSYKGAELQPSSCAMATIKNFDRTGGFKLDGYKEIIPSDKLKDSQKVELFDILVAHTDLTQKAEVIGNAEMVLSKSGYDEIIMSMDLVKVLPKHGISRFVLAALLRTDQFKDHALGYVNGTTVLHMSKKALPAFTLYFPEKFSELSEISCMLEAIYKKIAQNIEESRSLVKLRDTLLPKLMSGEIDVSEVEI